MTLYLPEGIRARGNGALFVAPAVANITAPRVTEFTATGAFVAHCDTYNWNWGAEQGTEKEARYCLSENVQSFGDIDYSVDQMVVVYDPQDPQSENYAVYLNMKRGTKWYILDRRGLPASTALAATQIGDVIPVEVGFVSRQEITDEAGAKIRAIIPLIIPSPPAMDVTLVA